MAYPNNPANSGDTEVITGITENFGLYRLPHGIKADIMNVPRAPGQMAICTDTNELAIYANNFWYYLPFTGSVATGVVTDNTTITGTGVTGTPLKTTGPVIPIGGTIGWPFTTGTPNGLPAVGATGFEWAALDSTHPAYGSGKLLKGSYPDLEALFSAMGYPWGQDSVSYNLPPMTSTIMRIK